MDFQDLVVSKLNPMFRTHGFKIVERKIHEIKYEFENTIIRMVYNAREESNTLWIGNNAEQVEIDNYVANEFFKSGLELSGLDKAAFVTNVGQFFLGKGASILINDGPMLNSLLEFNRKRSYEYTSKLLEKQYLAAADKAWASKNYIEVLQNLRKIDREKLPTSYKSKYTIAQSRIGKGRSDKRADRN